MIADHDAGPNAFFVKGARDLLAGVILAFVVHAPRRWTLRDVLLAFADAGTLRDLLGRSPYTADRLKYFEDPRTLASPADSHAASESEAEAQGGREGPDPESQPQFLTREDRWFPIRPRRH